jgi:hypothetical protein
MTGLPDYTENLVLVALILIVSGIGLLLVGRPTRRRKIAR